MYEHPHMIVTEIGLWLHLESQAQDPDKLPEIEEPPKPKEDDKD